MLGQGTFGQVVKGIHLETGEQVAIKIVKNKPAYFNQGLIEINILEMVSSRFFVLFLSTYNNYLCEYLYIFFCLSKLTLS